MSLPVLLLAIMEGDVNGCFRPDDPITRQEAAKALYYAADSMDRDD